MRSAVPLVTTATTHPAPNSGRPKLLLYSHDTFGLGNIRRTLLVAEALGQEYPNASTLIVTGSPMIHAFRLPKGVDYIKLPCLDRIAADQYSPAYLTSTAAEVAAIRRRVLAKTVLGFAPDLMLVDKRPTGVGGELLDTLKALHRHPHPPRMVLGIRDILDEPVKTRDAFRRHHAMAVIGRYYDEVWIYGEAAIFDAVHAYAFSEGVARKSYFCGYLRRPAANAARNGGPPHVLVTTGGGGDGFAIIEAYLEGMATLPRSVPLRTTVVFGPHMDLAARTGLLERYGHLADVDFVDFDAELARWYAVADVVVSMAGYNTVCELLSFGCRAVLVPRAQPVAEQLIRARLFAALGYFDFIEPEQLTPALLITKVLHALHAAAPPRTVDIKGLPRIRERARALLDGRCA